MREAILRLSVLYARDKQDRDQALKYIEECAYDPATLDDLRQKTDVDEFLTEQGLLAWISTDRNSPKIRAHRRQCLTSSIEAALHSTRAP